MPQVTLGKVRVVNGSQLVVAAWNGGMVSVTGTFSLGDAIEWRNSGSPGGSADGTGYVIRWESLTNLLVFWRDTGALPIDGAYISSASAHAVVSSFDAASPPHWDQLGIGSKNFLPGGTGTRYQIGTAGIQADRFTLTSQYADSSQNELAYAIHMDFTTNKGYPKPSLDDLDPMTVVAWALDMIDDDMP